MRRQDLIRQLVDEFRVLRQSSSKLPDATDAVVVLSAAPSLEFSDTERREKNPENRARVQLGVEITCAFAGPPVTLALDGETEQLPSLFEIALEYGFPEDRISLINSGDRGVSNTKTQIQKIGAFISGSRWVHVTLVTNDYHLPRVIRTAEMHLPVELAYTVIGVPHGRCLYPVFKKVRAEIQRILRYWVNGDIAL